MKAIKKLLKWIRDNRWRVNLLGQRIKYTYYDIIVWIYWTKGFLTPKDPMKFDYKYMRFPDGSPRKCFWCNSSRYLDDVIKDRINYEVCEYERVCTKCHRPVGYWAYGHWTN